MWNRSWGFFALSTWNGGVEQAPVEFPGVQQRPPPAMPLPPQAAQPLTL